RCASTTAGPSRPSSPEPGRRRSGAVARIPRFRAYPSGDDRRRIHRSVIAFDEEPDDATDLDRGARDSRPPVPRRVRPGPGPVRGPVVRVVWPAVGPVHVGGRTGDGPGGAERDALLPRGRVGPVVHAVADELRDRRGPGP